MATAAASAENPPPAGGGYRILALYRFVPLASPDAADNDRSRCEGDNATNDAPKWDEAALLARPEQHPTLRALQSELLTTLRKYYAKGTLLLAPEGINGTICYPFSSAINADPVATYLKSHPLFGGPELRTRVSVWNEEENGQQAFSRLKVKIKAEIVTLGLGRPLVDRTPQHNEEQRHELNQRANPLAAKGQYLTPTQWDEICRDPDVVVIDTRNAYEVDIGTFEGALDPKTDCFSEFPEYLEGLAREYDWGNETDCKVGASNGPSKPWNGLHRSNGGSAKKKLAPKGIAMFCTGGIRCEKATSYALQSGLFPSNLPIYHLEGGILAYLDDVSRRKEEGGPEQGSSTFHGECMIFDKRVAVTEGLRPSAKYVSCHGCRGPMDRRLLLPASDTECTDSQVTDKERQRHQDLTKGIPNLPPLQYDGKTKKHYLPGLTCPRCHATTTRESLERFAQRERQVEICARDGRPLFRDVGDDGNPS
ncbi:hypothetical protein ACHAXT_003983 [Thalassiosira profunda]